MTFGLSAKILQGIKSLSGSLKLWKLKGIKMIASETAAEPKQDLILTGSKSIL